MAPAFRAGVESPPLSDERGAVGAHQTGVTSLLFFFCGFNPTENAVCSVVQATGRANAGGKAYVWL